MQLVPIPGILVRSFDLTKYYETVKTVNQLSPTTPPSRRQNQYLSIDICTPLNQRQIQQETPLILQRETVSRSVCLLLEKIGKVLIESTTVEQYHKSTATYYSAYTAN